MAQSEKDPLRALPAKERTELVRLLQQYLLDHFDVEAGDLGAELLLARAGELVGPVYWNRALQEATTVMRDHADIVSGDLLAREKPLERRRGNPE